MPRLQDRVVRLAAAPVRSTMSVAADILPGNFYKVTDTQPCGCVRVLVAMEWQLAAQCAGHRGPTAPE